jgi:hypothetical protein
MAVIAVTFLAFRLEYSFAGGKIGTVSWKTPDADPTEQGGCHAATKQAEICHRILSILATHAVTCDLTSAGPSSHTLC